MRSIRKKFILPALLGAVFLAGLGVWWINRPQEIVVSNIAELMAASAQGGRTIRMKAGVYQLTGYLPLTSMAERRERKDFPFLVFNGDRNIYRMEGVVIELDTALRTALKPPVHTNEIVIAGSGNSFIGLEIRCTGDGTSPGGALVSIDGPGNTLRDCTFHVRGSFPYGYGDLFGKGGPDIIRHHKHSGVRVAGDDTTLIGCRLHMRSFGHGYFVQKDARNIRFENCEVEGVMRPTDEMLAETSGPAFDVDFRTIGKNREGVDRVTPGYMKALSEDGFRTYGEIKNLVFKNCTARNMRGGFELRTKGGATLDNCTVIGCERGFWVSDDAVITHSRGDAQFGPLLFAEGVNATIGLELLPTQSDRTVHALATIHGSGNKVTIKPAGGKDRDKPLPILIGYGTPSAGEGMSPIPERRARNIVLRNETSMPVIIGRMSVNCEVASRGSVKEDSGKATIVKVLPNP